MSCKINIIEKKIFFVPVHDDDTSTRFLCAQSCTASTFVYAKVRALAKCNLFQSEGGGVFDGGWYPNAHYAGVEIRS